MQIKHLCFLGYFVTVSTYAVAINQISHDPNMPFDVPLITWVYVIILISFGAVTGLIYRWSPEKKYHAFFRELAASYFAGLMVFFLCIHYEIATPLSAVALSMSAFGGTNFVDMFYRKYKHVVEKLWPQFPKNN